MTAAGSRIVAFSRTRSRWRDIPGELLVLLVLVPLLGAVVSSVTAPGEESKYAHWWGTSRGWEAMWRTLRVASLGAVVALGLSWALVTATIRWSRGAALVVALLSCVPLLVPSAALGKAWIFVLGVQSPLGEILSRAGFSVYSVAGAGVVLALRYFGIPVAILMHHQMRQLTYRPVERVFRISPVATAVHLRLRPGLRATLVAGSIVMLFCMNDHIIPETLLISTYGTQVMIQYCALLDLRGAAALAVPMGGVGMGLVGLALLLGRGSWVRSEGPSAGEHLRSSLLQRSVAGVGAMILLAAALVTPIVFLVMQLESVGALLRAVWDARGEVWQTLYCVGIASPICAGLAAVLGMHWVRSRRAGRLTAVPLVLLNLTVPATLLGIGIIELTQHAPLRGLRDSSWGLIFAYVGRFLPVATLAFYAAWRNDSPLPDLGARVHGVGTWRRARYVTWGRRGAMVLMMAVLCGLLIATELEMSILLVPTQAEVSRLVGGRGAATLGIHLAGLMHTAPDSMVSALTLGTLAIISPGIILFALLLRRYRRFTGGAG